MKNTDDYKVTWIPFSKRKPPPGGDYFVTVVHSDRTREVQVAYFTENGRWEYHISVAAWSFLPRPSSVRMPSEGKSRDG